MSNSRSQINSNFYQIANTDPTCGNITGVNVGNVWATGNVTGAYFFGNGSQLTGLPATYSNADVANYLQVLSSNVTTTANIQGAYILGNGSQLTGLPTQYSNANVAAYLSSSPNLNITVNGTVTASVFYGDVIGNIQGNFTVAGANTGVLFKDGGNANAVTGFTFDKTTNTASIGSNLTVGNVNAQFLYGNIRGTTGGYDDANVAAYLPGYLNTYTGNVQAGNLLVINSAVIQGNLQVLGNTTIIDANSLTIADKDITVANGATTASQANGAGLIVGAGNLANIIFNNPANAWTLYPGVSTPGNITGAYIIGNGYYLTDIQAGNIIGGYGNSQVAAYLQVLTSNVTTTANIQAAYFIGNGSQLTGLPASYSNANVAAYLPVYGGNILGNVITGNLRAVSLLPAYANGQLANGDVNIGSVTNYFGDIYATKLIVPPSNTNNGFEIQVSSTPGQSGVSFQDPVTLSLVDIYAATGYFDALDVNSSITADSYIEGNQLIATGNITAGGNANITNAITVGGSANIAGNITTSANVSGSYILGNGSQLTGLPQSYGNANVATFLNVGFGSNNINTVGNILTGRLTAIFSLISTNIRTSNIYMPADDLGIGTRIDGVGNINWTGNINSSYFIGDGSNLTNLPQTYSNANVANYLPTYSGNLGSIRVQFLEVNTEIDATGAVYAGGFYGNGVGLFGIKYSNIVGTYGNSNVATYLASNSNVTVTTTGNITAGYFFGNGALLSGINANYGNANVANYLPTYSGNLGSIRVQFLEVNTEIDATGAVYGGAFYGNGVGLFGIKYSNITGAYSNANVANYLQVLTSNVITTANISGSYILGNGSQLTGLPQTYSNANVANYLPIYTGNISAGNLTVTETVSANNIVATEDVSSNTMFAATLLTVGGNLIGGDADFGGNVLVGANLITTGNISATYYLGNGSQLTGITSTAAESFNPFLLAGM